MEEAANTGEDGTKWASGLLAHQTAKSAMDVGTMARSARVAAHEATSSKRVQTALAQATVVEDGGHLHLRTKVSCGDAEGSQLHVAVGGTVASMGKDQCAVASLAAAGKVLRGITAERTRREVLAHFATRTGIAAGDAVRADAVRAKAAAKAKVVRVVVAKLEVGRAVVMRASVGSVAVRAEAARAAAVRADCAEGSG